MPQIVVEDEGADAQPLGRGRDDGHRRDRRQLVDQVIGNHQHGEAGRLGATRHFA